MKEATDALLLLLIIVLCPMGLFWLFLMLFRIVPFSVGNIALSLTCFLLSVFMVILMIRRPPVDNTEDLCDQIDGEKLTKEAEKNPESWMN